MSYLDRSNNTQKVNAALGVGALHFLLGAGLLIGLAVKVAPDRTPDPIVVRLDPARPAPKPEPLPIPQPQMDDIRVQTDMPVIDYREQSQLTIVQVPDVPLSTEGGTVVPNGGQGTQVAPPPEPVRRAGEEGRVTIRVGIGTDGSVSGCTVTASSGHERLDRKTCQVAERRWRFTPATEDGVAVASSAERSIVWRLEDLR